MTPLAIGGVSLLALAILLLARIPLGFAMGLVGLSGSAAIIGWKGTLGLFGVKAFEVTTNYDFSIVPLFILMGAVASRSGLSGELYRALNAWVGAFKGGLALATVGACGAFAAICGSSVATAATMSRVAMPEMRRFGYADSLATGSVAAGGVIGILIPPSVVLVLYGILTETSIGDLFLAGIVPGVLTILGFMLAVVIMTRLFPEIGGKGEKTSLAEKFQALGRTWSIVLLFVVVIGGIYLGVFTPSEAASVGALGAFVIAAMRKRLTFTVIREALFETVQTTSMIFLVIIGAFALNNLLIFSGLARFLSDFVSGLDMPAAYVMAIILLIYLVLGCFLDALAMILLTVPIFFPIVRDLGYDPVWFGIIVVMVVELGLITPPIGMNMFILKGMFPQIPLGTIFRGVMPFVFAQIALIILIFLMPQIALWLPAAAAQ